MIIFRCSSVSAINATDVTVKLAAKPATALTDADASKFAVVANGTANTVKSVAVVATDATGVTYKLTLTNSLDKTQGNLTVNGTAPATKVATGSDYDYDFAVPTAQKVEAVDATHVKITFSEKMDDSATVLTGYKLVKNTDTAIDLLTDISGTKAFGVLSADKKSVTFTTNAALVPANYTLIVKPSANKPSGATPTDVKDLGGNAVYAGTELYFAPTGDQLADVLPSTLTNVTFNTETKKLVLTFDENVKITSIDKTKIKLGGVALGVNDILNTVTDGNVLTFTLADATVKALPTGTLNVDVADAALTDCATTPNAVKAQTVAAQKQSVPALVAASSNYDEATHKLTLKFDQPVKIADITKIQLGGVALSNASDIAAPKDIKDTASDTLVLELCKADAAASGISSVTTNTIDVKIPVAAGVVSATKVAPTQDVTATVALTQDTAVPALVNATYKNVDKSLYLEFSKPVQANAIADGLIKFRLGTDASAGLGAPTALPSLVKADGTALAPATDGTNYSKYIKIDLTAKDAAFAAANQAGKQLYVTLGKNAVYDTANAQDTTTSNGNATMIGTDDTKTTFKTVAYVDSNIPQFDMVTPANSVSVLSSTQLKLSFNTAMDKAAVENVANYALTNIMYPTKTYIVKSAMQDASDSKVVYLTVDNAMTDAAAGSDLAYKLVVSNLKSAYGVAQSATKNYVAFDGITNTADVKAPVLSDTNNGVVLSTIENKENDTIVVKLSDDSAIDKASAENLANYTLVDLGTDGKGSTALPLTTDTVKTIALSGSDVTITLKTIDLKNDHKYSVTVANVSDVLGNKMASVTRTNLTDPTNTKPLTFTTQETNVPAVASALGSAATDKTTVKVTFSEDMDAATAQNPDNYRVSIVSVANTTQTYAPAVVTYDVTTRTATFDVATSLAGTSFNVYVKGIKDLAGNSVAAGTIQIGADNKIVAPTVTANFSAATLGSLGDLVAPKFATTGAIAAEAKDALATTSDAITIKFDSPVGALTAEDERNYTVSFGGNTYTVTSNVTALDSTNHTVPFMITQSAPDTVVISMDTTRNFYKDDVVTVTSQGVKDLAGNAMVQATVSAKATAAAPAADGTGATGRITAAVASPNTIALTFADPVLASTVSTSDFTVAGNTVTDVNVSANGKTVTLTVAAQIASGAQPVIKASDSCVINDTLGNVLDNGELFNATTGITPAANAGATPLAGTSVADATGLANDGKTSVTLPALPATATSYLYKLSADTTNITTPAAGSILVAGTDNWVAAPTGVGANIITQANGNKIGIAAVNASGTVIQFVNVTAVTTDYTAATAGSSVGSIAIADNAALAGLTTSEDTKALTFTIDGVAKTYTIASSVTTKVDFLTALNAVLGAAGTASFDGSNHLKVVSATTGTTSTVVATGTAAAAIVGTPVENGGEAAAH